MADGKNVVSGGKDVSYEVLKARNPVWANPEHNMIDMEVDFTPLDEDWLPYTASPTDSECEHSRYLYKNAVDGLYGDIAEWPGKSMWTPWFEDKVEVSTEGLVQLLLEKGILNDEEVDNILIETSEFQGFSRPASDTDTHGGGANWGSL
tara:strand:- start:101 stop:547 length:447 start_codon:yes stop_codon:yes gene_type:complete